MSDTEKDPETQAPEADNNQVAKRGRRPKTAETQEPEADTETVKFILLKNHGFSPDGKVSKFYPAGTEFDVEKDKELISHLAKTGAQIEQK